MLSAYFNRTTGFNTLQKGAIVKDRVISELEEVTILGHTVPLHAKRGITALVNRDESNVPCDTHFFVRHSATWPRRHYFGVFF